MTKTKIETVTTASFSMDYFRFGRGGKPLVILPGISVQSVMGAADAVVEAYRPLADDFTVYLFDRRRNLPAAYSVHDMARDTAEAFRALGLDRVCLFGASQGGMIAMEIAIRQPELVQRLVLGSTCAHVTDAAYQMIGTWVRLARAGDATALYLAFGEALYLPDVFAASRELFIEAASAVTDEDLKRFVILAEGMKGFDVIDALYQIACPVLTIGAADDRVFGAAASAQIAERFRGRSDSAFYMYEGHGHAAYDTAPDYKERILRFLVPDANAPR